jgi:guanosine-3',5'-bis(diphosphate) 3'-pyrophosphohydrolase
LDSVAFILDALQFSAEKHRGQKRKDGDTAYINHPIAVAHILKHIGGVVDPVVLCGAILHDTLEDTQTSQDELIERFGKEIADIVWEVSDDLNIKADKSRDAERKQLEIDHAQTLSHQAKLVKIADKIANLRDILNNPPADWPIERKLGYFDWAKQVIDGVRGTNSRLETEFDGLYSLRTTDHLL